jgi:hypothetical protein
MTNHKNCENQKTNEEFFDYLMRDEPDGLQGEIETHDSVLVSGVAKEDIETFSSNFQYFRCRFQMNTSTHLD